MVKLSQFAIPVSEEFFNTITGLPGSVSSTVKGVDEADPQFCYRLYPLNTALKFITSPLANPVISSKALDLIQMNH